MKNTRPLEHFTWALASVVASCGGIYSVGDDLGYYPPPTEGSSPTPIVTHLEQPALASDGLRIYWSSPFDPTIVRGCDPAQCRSTLITYSAGRDAAEVVLAANETGVYWSATLERDAVQHLRACPLAGCTEEAPYDLTATGPAGRIERLQVASSHVYWLAQEVDRQDVVCNLWRSPVRTPSSPERLASFRECPRGLAVSDTQVYLSVTLVEGSRAVGRILSIPKEAPGSPRVVADEQYAPASVAIDAQRVYWTTAYFGGEVLACPLDGCDASGPTALVSGQNTPENLLVDADHVYFGTADGSTGDIRACPLAGCEEPPIVVRNTRAVAMTATHLYYTELDPSDDGRYRIMQASKSR